MSLSKKLACKGTLRQVFYLSEARSPPMTPYSPPLTLHTCILYTVYLFTQGGGGGESQKTESKLEGRPAESTNMTYCISSL